MQIEQRKVEELIPYVNNSRTHSDEQVAQIAASIKEFGFNNPILLDKDKGIIAGHGRLMAARKLGMEDVPTIELGHLTETQKKAYIIADNKLALNAGWDIDLLKLEFEELKTLNYDLTLTGFDELTIQSFGEKTDLGLLPEEKLDNFLNGDTKILRLAYDEQEFETMVNALAELGKDYGIEDFSSLIFYLVTEQCK